MANLNFARLECFVGLFACGAVIWEHQENHYQTLTQVDQQANAAHFITFMLDALHAAIREATITDQVTGQVAKLIQANGDGEFNSNALMQALELIHRPAIRENYLNPALSGAMVPIRCVCLQNKRFVNARL